MVTWERCGETLFFFFKKKGAFTQAEDVFKSKGESLKLAAITLENMIQQGPISSIRSISGFIAHL